MLSHRPFSCHLLLLLKALACAVCSSSHILSKIAHFSRVLYHSLLLFFEQVQVLHKLVKQVLHNVLNCNTFEHLSQEQVLLHFPSFSPVLATSSCSLSSRPVRVLIPIKPASKTKRMRSCKRSIAQDWIYPWFNLPRPSLCTAFKRHVIRQEGPKLRAVTCILESSTFNP